MTLSLSPIFRRASLCAIALLFVFCSQSLAQNSTRIQEVPINPLLRNHTNWFDPVNIYDLRKQHYPLPDAQVPKDIRYDVYSAVGYDLANTMVIKGPKNSSGRREVVIVDTLGNPGITKEVINYFRATKGLDGDPILPAGPLPIRAIIYTHNHIDHTFGVWGYLTEADRPPCRQEDPLKPGPDGYFDVDAENKDCVAVIGQYKINDGVGTTAFITGTIRNGIAEFIETTPHGDNLSKTDVEHANLAISIEKKTLDELLIAEMKGEQYFWIAFGLAVARGDIEPLNNNTTLESFKAAFTGYFDPKPVGLTPLTVR